MRTSLFIGVQHCLFFQNISLVYSCQFSVSGHYSENKLTWPGKRTFWVLFYLLKQWTIKTWAGNTWTTWSMDQKSFYLALSYASSFSPPLLLPDSRALLFGFSSLMMDKVCDATLCLMLLSGTKIYLIQWTLWCVLWLICNPTIFLWKNVQFLSILWKNYCASLPWGTSLYLGNAPRPWGSFAPWCALHLLELRWKLCLAPFLPALLIQLYMYWWFQLL